MVVLTQLLFFAMENAVHVSHFQYPEEGCHILYSQRNERKFSRSKLNDAPPLPPLHCPTFSQGVGKGAVCRFIITNCNSINGVHFLP